MAETEAQRVAREKMEEVRDKLRDGIEGFGERLREGINPRAKEGVQSAMKGGRRPVGRPPTRRPPSGRPPSGRPPSSRRQRP
jgi:hypothetical protein